MTAAPGRLFCLGFGYCATFLAAILKPQGWEISGTSREGGNRIRNSIPLLAFDGATGAPDVGAAIAQATHVLISIPPDDAGDPVLRHFAGDLSNAEELRWTGYLSTTGVYGDSGGTWVDEETPIAPTGPRARRRAAAEAEWLTLCPGLPVHVFRLAGIYGPGRSALDQVRAGTARRVTKPGHLFSRIHVADIAATLAASMARPRPGALYNVCDDMPASSADVVTHACRLLGVEPPPEVAFADADLSDMARSFYLDNRRVRNDRIKTELGVALRYSDYRAGLAAMHGQMGDSC